MTTTDPFRTPVKCVVWDLDNTLWAGVAVETDTAGHPSPDPRILGIIKRLEGRGIVSSIASRNDPSLLSEIQDDPELSGLFVAPQISWEPKSGSLRKIALSLNIDTSALAFVDDSPFERAEVAYMLPEVLVLAPDELDAALRTPAFNPPRLTPEGSRRAEMYREEEGRREAEAKFEGSRADFLAQCDMHLSIGPAQVADLPRLAEMTERTHQLNSTGTCYSEAELRGMLPDPSRMVITARLVDRFGDYGLIGAAIVDKRPEFMPDAWLAELVMLSCRVEGRGIPAALVLWLAHRAQQAGMKSLLAGYRQNAQNLPVRLLFRQLGFSAVRGASEGGAVTVSRDLSVQLPPYPEWLHLDVQEPQEAGRA